MSVSSVSQFGKDFSPSNTQGTHIALPSKKKRRSKTAFEKKSGLKPIFPWIKRAAKRSGYPRNNFRQCKSDRLGLNPGSGKRANKEFSGLVAVVGIACLAGENYLLGPCFLGARLQQFGRFSSALERASGTNATFLDLFRGT